VRLGRIPTRDLEKERVVTELYLSGLSQEQVGANVGITKQRVSQLLQRAGVLVNPARYAEMVDWLRREHPEVYTEGVDTLKRRRA
jgi:hypothetical protein